MNSCKKILRQRKQAGFTLVETMAAIVVMLIAMTLVVSGISSAQRAYVKMVDGANAQVLLSTTATMLRDELDKATNIHTSSNNSYVTYTSSETWETTKIKKDDSGRIVVVDASNKVTPLVPEVPVSGQTVSSDLVATYDQITRSGGVIKISGLKVTKAGYGTLAALNGDLVIRPIVA